MKKTSDEAICVYGAGILLKHLAALEKEQEGVRSGDADIEYIHRMRVASRRLRAALPLFEGCLPRRKAGEWLKDIRRITQALGAARDADVQIDALAKYTKKQEDPTQGPGLTRLMLRLRQQRATLQPPLEEALARLEQDNTVADLRAALEPLAAQAEQVYAFTPQLYKHAFTHITGRLADFLGYAEIVHQPEKVTELHEMRIAAKWLRYTMENFAPLYGGELKEWLNPVRDMQEQLGDIHDCDVWGTYLPGFMAEERERMLAYIGHTKSFHRLTVGLEGFLADRNAMREKRYAQFRVDWDVLLEKDAWGGLRKQISMPVTLTPNWPPPNPQFPGEA